MSVPVVLENREVSQHGIGVCVEAGWGDRATQDRPGGIILLRCGRPASRSQVKLIIYIQAGARGPPGEW